MSTTLDRLGTILVRDYGVAADRVTPEAALDSLGVDSLGTVELLWTVEDEFKIKLPTEPVELPTLADVVAYIDAAMASKGGASNGVEPAPKSADPAAPTASTAPTTPGVPVA